MKKEKAAIIVKGDAALGIQTTTTYSPQKQL